MKKLLGIAVLTAGCLLSAVEPTELTGDVRLSCEAILCLSSAQKPGECQPSLSRYFSIKAKKLKDTIKKRKDFLKLCPVGDDAEKDGEFVKLRDEFLAQVDNTCDVNMLNSNIEYKGEEICGEHRCKIKPEYARVSDKLDKSCQFLMSSAYTNIRPKYICDKKFYPIEDWNNGYTLREISKRDYDIINAKDSNAVVKKELTIRLKLDKLSKITKYYLKEPINKKCWVNA